MSEVIDISPAHFDSSLSFIQPHIHMMYSAYKLNKQGDNIQPWCTHFPIWNQSIVPCLILTPASWHAYKFLRRQVRWSGIPIFLRIFHSDPHSQRLYHINWSRNKCFFLEFLCFFKDPADVGNLIFGSSAFLKSSLYNWKFYVHVLLKHRLKDFEHYLASMWNECNCGVIWTFFGIALLWVWDENWPFRVLC